MFKNTNSGLGYRLACILLPVSLVLYAASLTMNVARVEGRVAINETGITEMLKARAAEDVSMDRISDEISGLIRDYVWKKKQDVPGFIAGQIDISDISRTMNKEVKARGKTLIDSMLKIDVPSPAPQVQEIKLLETIRDLYQGTATADRDVFLATCILLFTIFFPISKYLALGWILLPASRHKSRNLNWLKTWGQWSMGDVFVVAFMVTFLKINSSVISTHELAIIRVHVDVLNGMYIFGAAIILSMIASMLVTHYVREMTPEQVAEN